MSDQLSLSDGMSLPCPHGVDLHYFICDVCKNVPDQVIPVDPPREATYTRTFTEVEQVTLTRALLKYRRSAPDDLDVVDGILRGGWSS